MAESEHTAGTAQDGVFLRKSSGVIRSMSSRDAMYYGYLAAAGLFALPLFLFVSAAVFPNANIWVANVLAFVLFLSVWITYANLASAMPRSGGDYVFTSRLLKPSIGYIAAWGCWVIWGFFFVYLATSSIITAFLAPLLSAIGVATGNSAWTSASDFVLRSYSMIVLSFAMILGATWIMIRGMKTFLVLQRTLMLPASFVGLALIVISFVVWPRTTFFQHFNIFQQAAGGVSAAHVIPLAHQLGFAPSHSVAFDTAAVTVQLAFFYIWTIYSTELLGEVKQANQMRVSFSMYFGAGLLQFITFMIGMGGAYLYFGSSWLRSFSWLVLNYPEKLGAGWDFRGVPTLLYIPSLNIVLGVVLFLCFLGPMVQCVFNPALSSSRLLLAMSFDRMLPRWLGAVNKHGVPYAAIWLVDGVAMAVTVAVVFMNFTAIWFWAGWATFLGMTMSLIAGTIFPWSGRTIFEVSPGAKWRILGVPAVTFSGVIATVMAVSALTIYLVHPGFGMLQSGSARQGLIAMIASLILPAVGYVFMKWWRGREGIDIGLAFSQVPRA